ncbi:hypothetical protein MNBD_UNCLBAC01-289 [hydrothermal vent metagenome]|uniref:Uncharacterized protein n=1 Tax=hydrothermal vent metagenome TaxID=652676 RepID=A0A3B1DYX2_9ZZZZ
MFCSIEKKRSNVLFRCLSVLIVVIFAGNIMLPPQLAFAQSTPSIPVLNLPTPGMMITTTSNFYPPLVKGMTIHPDNPLAFDFIINRGEENLQGDQFEAEATKLVKYFLAALTTPEEKIWVNLSPYEKSRVISKGFGDTEMGRDMLAQDYMLKQLTASLMYPEKELGKEFWSRVYQRVYEEYGATDISMNTFNKVWIVPQEAIVHEKDGSVFVVDTKLKVMLEEDYVALNENIGNTTFGLDSLVRGDAELVSGITSKVVKNILIPEIEKEVNNGKVFANLRQIYNSVILATWYKKYLTGNGLDRSLLGQIYVDQQKTKGVDTQDKAINTKIYNQYVEAFKKGVYNYIKEDYGLATQEMIPRKYFSGGMGMERVSSAITDKKNLSRSRQEAIERKTISRDRKDGGVVRALFNLAEVPEGQSPELVMSAVDKLYKSDASLESLDHKLAASPISIIQPVYQEEHKWQLFERIKDILVNNKVEINRNDITQIVSFDELNMDKSSINKFVIGLEIQFKVDIPQGIIDVLTRPYDVVRYLFLLEDVRTVMLEARYTLGKEGLEDFGNITYNSHLEEYFDTEYMPIAIAKFSLLLEKAFEIEEIFDDLNNHEMEQWTSLNAVAEFMYLFLNSKTTHKAISKATLAASPIDVGGINFNANLIDLQIKRDGNGIPLPINQQVIGEIKIDGFIPVMINVIPVNLPLLLGFDSDTETERQSAEYSYQTGNEYYRQEDFNVVDKLVKGE